jgi:hypothetical protein
MIKKANALVPVFREISAYSMSEFIGIDGPTLHTIRHHSKVTLSLVEEI